VVSPTTLLLRLPALRYKSAGDGADSLPVIRPAGACHEVARDAYRRNVGFRTFGPYLPVPASPDVGSAPAATMAQCHPARCLVSQYPVTWTVCDVTDADVHTTNRRLIECMFARGSAGGCTVDAVPSLVTSCAENCSAMADELALPSVVEWDAPEDIDMDGEVADRTRGSTGAPAAGPSAQATPREADEGEETINPRPTAHPPSDEEKGFPDDPPEGRTIFGRWATIVPIDGMAYCHLPDPSGPLQALVLPPASQVRQRYEQALAFMRQQPVWGTERRGQRTPPSPGPRLGLLPGGPGYSPSLDAAAAQGYRCPLAPLVVRSEHPGTRPPASPGAAGPQSHVSGGGIDQ